MTITPFPNLLLGLFALYVSNLTYGKDIEPTSLVRSLAFEHRQEPRMAFATNSDYFLHIAIKTLRGTEQHFYAGQWRREELTQPENAAVFQTCVYVQQDKCFDVRWKQLEPEGAWPEFIALLRKPSLYKILGKFRLDDKIVVADGVRIELEIQYERTHIRTVIDPIHDDEDVLEFLSQLQQMFGFKFSI